MIAGTIVRLRVAREVSPYGFFVTDGTQDVLLHYSEIVGQKIKVGDDVEVFIYYDTDDRISATMRKPLITLGEMARLRVADIHPRLGCFLEIGLGRQLLLPLSELPENKDFRPIIGDEVFVVLHNDKQGRLIAKLAGEDDFTPKVFRAPSDWRNRWIEGWVTKTLQMGSFVLLDGGVLGFGAFGMIPAAERNRTLRLGERVRARVTFVREDGRVNLSLGERKEVGRLEDADRVLAFLKERPNGAMPYSDETPADLIKQRFGISKSAFKRALGKLMRDGLVEQEGNWTKLIAKPNEDSSADAAKGTVQ